MRWQPITIIFLLIFSASVAVAQDGVGEVVQLQGQVLDTEGNPLAGAVVEIWHTDVNGNYDHPNDTPSAELIDTFQYFGTATADDEGYYAFLTIKPAAYDFRPTHIHVKVKIDGEDALITQFYFEEDRDVVEQDGAFANAGDTLFLTTSETTDVDDNPLRIATGNLILDLNGADADTLTPTARQAEGPYYPVVDFSDYDNNLNSAAHDDEPVLPILDMFSRFNLNTATGDEFLTIPNMNNRMVREFFEYRPYISILQFRREIGKYVDEQQVADYEAYVYVPVDVNESDAATLMQLPGVDEAVAESLMAARPYESNDAFLDALNELVSPGDRANAAHYLAIES